MHKIRILFLVVLFALSLLSLNLSAQYSTEINNLIEQEKYLQALVSIDQKLINKKNDQELLYLKAQLEVKINKIEPAIITYQQVIKLYPVFPEAYNNLAGIFAKQGKLELAKETLEKGLSTNKSYAQLHSNINNIYLEMARESYVKALQLGVKKHTIELNLATIEQRKNSKNQYSSKPVQFENSIITDSVVVRQKPIGPKKTVQRIAKKKIVVKAWSEPIISVKDEVITALQGWAAAWSAQDVELYLSFYNKQFLPENGISRGIWTAQRQSRLRKPRWIEVRLSNFLFEQQADDQAEVRLTQIYRSNSFRDKSKKKFLLTHSEDGWQILNEINFQE